MRITKSQKPKYLQSRNTANTSGKETSGSKQWHSFTLDSNLIRKSNSWSLQAHRKTAKGDCKHAGEDSYTGSQSLPTWGTNECDADINSYLQNMIDAQEQYSRRWCAIINGMAKPEHQEGADNSDDESQVIETLERECGISPDVIKNNLDKTHPIGRPDEYGKQLRINKFTIDSFKETVFRKHKHRRNLYTERHKRSGKPVQIKVKLQPSLTRHRIGLLKFANSQFRLCRYARYAESYVKYTSKE